VNYYGQLPAVYGQKVQLILSLLKVKPDLNKQKLSRSFLLSCHQNDALQNQHQEFQQLHPCILNLPLLIMRSVVVALALCASDAFSPSLMRHRGRRFRTNAIQVLFENQT
jgi:hypothetical protein